MRRILAWVWIAAGLVGCAQGYTPDGLQAPDAGTGDAATDGGARVDAGTPAPADGSPESGRGGTEPAQTGGAGALPTPRDGGWILDASRSDGGCDADTDGDGTADCEDRCPEDPGNRPQCGNVNASNVDTALLGLLAAPPVHLNCGVTIIDTSGEGMLHNWCGKADSATPALVVQEPLMALPVASLNVARGATLRVTGERPLAIISANYIRIAGDLDASADGERGGAGSGLTCEGSGGASGTGSSSLGGGGGGGGGFGTAGGAGGEGMRSAGGMGGESRSNPSLSPLAGGCPGGVGGGCSGSGGGGGGAVQLSAAGPLQVSGSLHSAGGTGGTGCGSEGGGSGGGSGGGLLLEGTTVDITEASFDVAGGDGGPGANGGRGGRGATDERTPGAAGADHLLNGGGGGGGGHGRVIIRAMTECSGC